MKKWFEEEHAPPPGTFLCSKQDIDTGQVREFRFGENTNFRFRMFIYNDEGEFRAFKNACPHYDVPLNYIPDQVFSPDGKYFFCMTHSAKFDTGSGLCVEGPCEGQSLDVIPLVHDGERLLIGQPEVPRTGVTE